MWIALLVGLGLGVLGLMALAMQRDKRYRRLLSDPHLIDLARALDAARTATIAAPAMSSEGLGLVWQAVGVHAGLVVRSPGRLAPEAARFLLGVCAKAVGRDITALLVVPEGWALIVPGPVPAPPAAPTSEDLAAWRTAGIEAMRSQPLVPGALAAYR